MEPANLSVLWMPSFCMFSRVVILNFVYDFEGIDHCSDSFAYIFLDPMYPSIPFSFLIPDNQTHQLFYGEVQDSY